VMVDLRSVESSVLRTAVQNGPQWRREDPLTIRELSSLRRSPEQLIERLNCRGTPWGG